MAWKQLCHGKGQGHEELSLFLNFNLSEHFITKIQNFGSERLLFVGI